MFQHSLSPVWPRLFVLALLLAGLVTTNTSGVFSAAGDQPAGQVPAWAPNTTYATGAQVTYNGVVYRCLQGHTSLPGWEPPNVPALWTPSGPGGPTPTRTRTPVGPTPTRTRTPTGPTRTPTRTPTSSGGFVVSRAQFDQMFPNRNPFYTYDGLVAARSSFPAFAGTGSDTVRKQEAAAALANFSHETGGLVHIEEIARGEYCSPSAQWPCAPGKRYYGRGPIQLSWNFNYGAAGQALGLPLLADPDRVARESAVAWRTALWYWMTQNGPGTMTPHNAMVNNRGFGETIRSINGSLECNGGNPAQVQSRINNYQRFTQILGVPTGGNLSC